MSMILALNGVPMDAFGNFGEFGAASVPVAGLQTALANFGTKIGDASLKAITIDGLIGPETTAAANRALRQHIGAGQAPQDLRTGVLTQAQVFTNAAQIAQLVNTEARRRGFGIEAVPTTVKKPVVKKPVVKKTAAKAPAQSTALTYLPPSTATPAQSSFPTYGPPLPPDYAPPSTITTSKTYVVPSTPSLNVESVVKWSAIGLGVVALLGGAYYYVTKRQGQPAMAGFGARRAGTINNKDREQWVHNDDGLYRWYRSQSHPMREFIKRERAGIDARIQSARGIRPAMAGFGALPMMDQNALEAFVDKAGGTRDVIESLANIVFEKAEHLRANWQDDRSARVWDRLGRKLNKMAAGKDLP
jgi:lysozyme family protein